MIHIENIEEYAEYKTREYVVIKFGAEWCGPCKRIEPDVNSLAEQYPDISFISVDIDKVEVVDSLNIRSLPTFKFFYSGQLQDFLTFAGADVKILKEHVEKLHQTELIQTYA